MRVTVHSGRTHSNGNAFNKKHNDRQFEQADEQKNIYWNYTAGYNADGTRREYSDTSSELSFEDAETRFYNVYFRSAWSKTQERYMKRRQLDRLRDFESWKERFPAEEEWLQVGNLEGGTVHPDTFREMYDEYVTWQMQWSKEHGSPFVVINYAMHFDERVPHGQLRRVWLYEDAAGDYRPGQEEALKKAGIELPDPDAKSSRYNNRKQVFTKLCREKWQAIVREHGIQIDTEPVKRSDKRHMEQSVYWARELAQRASDVTAREEQADLREIRLTTREKHIQDGEQNVSEREEALKLKEESIKNREEAVKIKEDRIVEAINRRARELYEKMQETDEIEAKTKSVSNRRYPSMYD